MDMNRYENGQIYKIVSPDFEKCYIGSTCESLSQRMARHKGHYNAYLKGKHPKTRSFELFDEFGFENCKIYWIEDYPCNSKKELEAREGYYIEKTECVNKTQLGRSKQQWFKDNEEYVKQLKQAIYNKHKDDEDFKKQNQQRASEYYAEKKDEINEKRRVKAVCNICGSTIRKDHMKQHQQTKKCKSHIAEINT